MSKPLYRQQCLQKRLQGTFDETALCAQVQSLLREHPFHTVAFYWPIKAEADLRSCLLCLKTQRYVHCLALPCIKNQRMAFLKWDQGMPLGRDDMKMPVPLVRREVIPDCILIPCLAVDRQGYRLGYGGGWYDRTLPMYPRALKMGVLYEAFLLDVFPHESTDVALDGWVTEYHWYIK